MANNTKTGHIEIWQWNCCTLRTKLANFTHYIESAPIPPDVICIQEIGKQNQKLKGYELYAHPDYPQVATFAKKDVAISVNYFSGNLFSTR